MRVEGRGSFQNSGGLKEFAAEMVGRGYREFVVDLRGCQMMDSTFMGTLAGIALRLREIGVGGLAVVNPNERNRELLANLGLDQLFRVGDGPEQTAERLAQERLTAGAATPREQAQTMLDAHQALVEADPENFTKFKDVLEFLRQDLRGGV